MRSVCATALLLGLSGLTSTHALAAPTITQLYAFSCNSQTLLCPDGRDPVDLFQSSDGNFYGIAAVTQNINRISRGGTIFKISSGGTFTLLYTFAANSSGNYPEGDVPNKLVEGSDGNLYGVTAFGGEVGASLDEDGVIFRIRKSGTGYTVLHDFCSSAHCADGANPTSFVLGGDGNFYGTAQSGGSFSGATCQTNGCGTVFRITPSGSYTVLHTFSGTDGSTPFDMKPASDGNFYGSTYAGTSNVFRITPSGAFTVLHSFASPAHAATGVTQSTNGLLYGVSGSGTTTASVFSLSTSGSFNTVMNITEASTRWVMGDFLQGSDGNLWNTSSVDDGYGTVFAIAPSGTIVKTLAFTGANGQLPDQGVIEGSDGNLYGTTSAGGTDSGGKRAFGVIFTVNAGLPK